MKKFVCTILILIAVLGIAPRAKAFWGFGDITIDIVNQVKDWVVDALPKTIARHMMVRLQQEIARWAQGGFTDENKPFAMIDWKQELADIANLSSSRFIQEFNLTPLCAPIKVSLGTALGFDMPYGNVPYEIYGACTLQNVVDNVEEFYKNPSIAVYGWDTWTALMQPQNNFLGSAVMALGRKEEIKDEETESLKQEVQAGGGIKNETICNETDLENCQTNCYAKYQQELDIQSCQKACEKSSIGVCLQETTKKLGLEIKASVDKVIGSDVDWLISADEITEIIDLVFSGLFNKLTHGISGLLTKPTSTTTLSKNQAQYGYYQDYKKSQTPTDLEKLRTDILENILRAVKSITTSAYECNKDYQLKGDVYSEVAADILNEESQHLYTATEGVNLKPDYEVLDGPNNPNPLLGVTWDDIPFARYPNQCAEIKGVRCKDIKTRLPYELKISNINAECAKGCLATINDYREACRTELNTCIANCSSVDYSFGGASIRGDSSECKDTCQTIYDTCGSKTITQSVTDGKCSSYAIGKACLDGAIMIDRAENRCDDCTTQAQAKCESMTDVNEKTRCLNLYCNNYQDITISPSITGARDFYNRCQAAEFQNSCYVCLKEYFMPASYCEVVYDFINRSFVKYPALVYENLWWGMFNKFDSCAENRSSGQQIFTGLICRILPDFIFSDGSTCKTRCKATAQELKNTFDDEPNDSDCTPMKYTAGAYHPGGQYIPFLVNKKVKCCAALTGNNQELYNKCRGISGPIQQACTYGLPVYDEPQCYCQEGEMPLGFTRTGDPNRGPGASMGGDCGNVSITVPKGAPRVIYGITNASPVIGDAVYLVKSGSCNETIASVNSDATYNGSTSDDVWQKVTAADNNQKTITIYGASGTYNAGVYVTGTNKGRKPEKSTGWHICAECSPDDPGYNNGYYGHTLNQCYNKVQQ